MNRYFFAAALLFTLFEASAQEENLEIGRVAIEELIMTRYERDTSAVAVVLDEFGSAKITGDGYNKITFDYYTRIKILKEQGLNAVNLEIPLYIGERVREVLYDVKAVSHNLENGEHTTTEMTKGQVFTEKLNKNRDVQRLAIPNVRVGSVVEIYYQLESPFIRNFWPWEFQSDIPKIQSEYWARIPGNYIYDITLRGYQALSKNDQKILSKCISSGTGYTGYSADCVQYKFGMKNIPAFVEENYMTARRNFLSALHFELSEIKRFDGSTSKYTKDWKDAQDEFRQDENFGMQLKRAKDIEQLAVETVKGLTDPLEKAKRIYSMVQQKYTWNEHISNYCELGVKKAFETGRGNVADINLSLIAALREVGLKAEPLLLSTRSNGILTEHHPVVTEFNYVLATVTIDDKTYTLDATDKWLPFGMVPVKCLNGKGRVFENKDSYWIDLKPEDKDKEVIYLDLTLGQDGTFRGEMTDTHIGYGSYEQRKDIVSVGGPVLYVEELKRSQRYTVTDYSFEGLDDLSADLREKYNVEIESLDGLGAKTIIFNPFFFGKIEKNPFRSQERSYPVDFAVPIDITYVAVLRIPEEYEITELPEASILALPNNGGRFVFNASTLGNNLTLKYQLTITRTIFSSREYYSLKELFNRIVQIQNFDLIYTKK